MSLGISVREKVPGKGWRYQRIEEKRGVKTSSRKAPFYIRRNGNWHTLSAQTFADAQAERDEIENGKNAILGSDRVTLKSAVAQFLEMKKRKNESTVQNYTYILNEFLEKTSAKFVDEFNDQKNGRRIFDEFISVLEEGGAAPKTIAEQSYGHCVHAARGRCRQAVPHDQGPFANNRGGGRRGLHRRRTQENLCRNRR